ncbi:MAG: TadE family protein [Blastopirellula sp. JB062]
MRKQRTAIAAVELAICLPLLIAITVFTVDAANVHYAKVTLDSAVRIGVQRGATNRFTPFTYDQWRDDAARSIREEMEMMPGFADERFESNVEADAVGDRVTVTATASYRIPTLFNWSGLGTEIPLVRQYELRQVR